ncbi:MAG: O-antigen ligase family protein, partial [Anaerolineae bacterium]
MKTSLGAWAEGILEAVALVALAAVPAFANYYSQSVFEGDKTALLATVVAFGAVAALIALGERGGRGWRQVARQPVVLAVVGVVVAEALATTAAVDRRLAIVGSYERAHGLLTALWLVVVFAAVAWRASRPDARRRLAATAFAASAPVAAYALAQALGAEVVPGVAESASRVFGTMANPIFLGAYLMLAVPVGLGLVVDGFARGAKWTAAAVALVVAVDATALFLSDSRGSLLGLGFGLLVGAAAALGATGRRRGVIAVIALVAAAIAFLAVFNFEASPLAPLRDAPVIGRLGRISQTGSGSEATRMRIWRGVDRLVRHTVAEEPARLLVGYGPESLKYEILPFAEANVGGPQQADRLTDRAHNQLLDALVMSGLFGALARLAFLAAAFVAALGAVVPSWGG